MCVCEFIRSYAVPGGDGVTIKERKIRARSRKGGGRKWRKTGKVRNGGETSRWEKVPGCEGIKGLEGSATPREDFLDGMLHESEKGV